MPLDCFDLNKIVAYLLSTPCQPYFPHPRLAPLSLSKTPHSLTRPPEIGRKRTKDKAVSSPARDSCCLLFMRLHGLAGTTLIG